jgi:tRNA-2-methylthio-N6-dimethylallyladenosine synthase
MKELRSYYIKTYGCAMNYADSNRIRYILNAAAMKEVFQAKEAELIVLNSCSVRKQAEDKIAGWGIKEKQKGKEKQNKNKKTYVLTGCMAVRHNRKDEKLEEKYTKAIKRKFPWINHIVDIRDIEKIPEVLGLKTKGKQIHVDYLNIPTENTNEVVANIPISTGCNFFCSYCVVPYSRGKLLQRNFDDIMKEVKTNLDQGKKLICLVAQNVNSWQGMKNGKRISFADLLNEVASIDGDFWITFVSSNPMDFSDEIINVISKNGKVIRWINIAVQSGSDEILKRMNRKYTVEEFENLIGKIKKEIPDIRLTTDIIVGFPGESESDFQKTLELTKKVKFQMLYVGKYSPREFALSAKFEDDVPLKEKKRRENILKDELNKMRAVFHEEFVGKKLKILVIGGRRGLSYYYHEVLFEKPLPKEKIGTFVEALVVDSTLSGLVAKA